MASSSNPSVPLTDLELILIAITSFQLPTKLDLPEVDFDVTDQGPYDICTPVALSDCISRAMLMWYKENFCKGRIPLSPQNMINHIKDPKSYVFLTDCLDYCVEFGLSPVEKYPFIQMEHTQTTRRPSKGRFCIADYTFMEHDQVDMDFAVAWILVNYKVPIVVGIHASDNLKYWSVGDPPFVSGYSGNCRLVEKDGEWSCEHESLHHHVVITGFNRKKKLHRGYNPWAGDNKKITISFGEITHLGFPKLYQNSADCIKRGGKLTWPQVM